MLTALRKIIQMNNPHIVSLLLLFPLALNAMEQTITPALPNYKVEEEWNLGDAHYYQQLQIAVSLKETNHTATDQLHQFISQSGTYIPSKSAKDIATVSSTSGYSAHVQFGAFTDNKISLQYTINQASSIAYYFPFLSPVAPVTQIGKAAITTKINEEYTVPILNGIQLVSMLKIKALLITHPIPKKPKHNDDVLPSSKENS